MSVECLDYSWARPDPAQMHAGGVKFVCRYLWGPGKGLTLQEVVQLHGAGLGIVLNYEANPGDAFNGYQAGQVAGRDALHWATSLGAPKGLPIYFSVDSDVTTQMNAVIDYFKGIRSVLDGWYEARAYGEADVLDALANAGVARYGWQTLAWSDDRVSTHAVLYQYAINEKFNGSDVDYNRVLDHAHLGAWGGPTPVPPAPPVEDDDMALIIKPEQGNSRVLLFGDETMALKDPRTVTSLVNDGKVHEVTFYGTDFDRIQQIADKQP